MLIKRIGTTHTFPPFRHTVAELLKIEWTTGWPLAGRGDVEFSLKPKIGERLRGY